MYRLALLALLACLGGSGRLSGDSGIPHPSQALAISPDDWGPLSAQSVLVEPNRLWVREPHGALQYAPSRELAGRVLVCCPIRQVCVNVWALPLIIPDFQWNNPPGAGPARVGVVRFPAPVPLVLLFLDKNGAVIRMQRIRVKEVRESLPPPPGR